MSLPLFLNRIRWFKLTFDYWTTEYARTCAWTASPRKYRFHARSRWLGHIKIFTYEELTKRDKANLDIFWLKDDALEDSANLPAPDIIGADITADLEAALEQFREITEDLTEE